MPRRRPTSAPRTSPRPAAPTRSAGADPVLTHLNASGEARMVDVSAKDRTVREAVAEGFVVCAPGTIAILRDGRVPKGDALAVARLAAIQGAKRTPDLVPLCHPVALTGVDVETTVRDDGVLVRVTARAADRTGVEMEAMTGAAAAMLSLYDMLKAVERGIVLGDLRLVAKSGGRSGTWTRAERTERTKRSGVAP